MNQIRMVVRLANGVNCGENSFLNSVDHVWLEMECAVVNY